MACKKAAKSSCEFDIPVPVSLMQPMFVKEKRLLGAGPSNPPSDVLKALSLPMMGHLHPETLKIMDDIKDGLKYVFQTSNPLTLCISASGHGGMEAALCNLIEEGDVVLCGVTGLWGRRAGDMATRYGADVRYVETGNDEILTMDILNAYFEVHKPKIFFVTQGDSSTGVLQPIEGLGDLCQKYDCLLVVDTVASLGGTPFFMDKWKVDVVYTGSQKVLGAPPGLAPISFNARAIRKVLQRHHKVPVYYWDIMLLSDYWNCFNKPRIYHHTISATLLYGLREALAAVCKEGLDKVIDRHQKASTELHNGLKQLGMELYVKNATYRLPTITSIKIPKEVDWKRIVDIGANDYAVEIAGGLGPTAGQIIRIGLMGENARSDYVATALNVLREAMRNIRTLSNL
ncbi:serine--pyruvate aminotransferase, mitochondrial [Contarinia nasturtii]|uniref:serine--pyruvate aminotransferase, mitochondrial n=1 Tax=Contarinia nasturtii TaxID=265458 RepID=UPI0012D3CAA8|nr:serine--pyruvate aminotransferase, mitochondrial [Contarinia nasturtii]